MKNFRLVARNSLADLETQVRYLESNGWTLEYGDNNLTVEQALDALKRNNPVAVAMSREKTNG
jgi:hypothetical protein